VISKKKTSANKTVRPAAHFQHAPKPIHVSTAELLLATDQNRRKISESDHLFVSIARIDAENVNHTEAKQIAKQPSYPPYEDINANDNSLGNVSTDTIASRVRNRRAT
jgi:hypothetical protein